jgi:uncharacterized protein (DUF1778 family)
MHDMTRRLVEAGYLCEDWFGAAVAASLATKPVAGALLFGPIGTGKSYLPEVLAGILGADYYFYQCFPGTREEDLLVKMLPSETTVSGIALHDGVMIQAVRATRADDSSRPVILVLDEWDKTRPSADSFLLDFLQTGRVNFSGRVQTANLERLLVFLTFNVERELSEPLLRRLPKIDFTHLPPSLVYRALLLTHRDHPLLYSAVVLYERCLMAELSKPATIQELRQLLDAVTMLGREADWDLLVYQFVTKSEENHERLRRTEKDKSRWIQRYRGRLDVAAYEAGAKPLSDAGGAGEVGGKLPRLAEARFFDEFIEGPEEDIDLAQAGGLLELTKSAYNELVRLVDQPESSPHRLGDLAEVRGRYITLTKTWPLSRVGELDGLWGENGEILLTEPLAEWEDVKALAGWAPIQVIKFARQEILAKTDGVDLRWTPERGAEIIVDLAKRHVFQHVFGQSWGQPGEAKWIGRKGSIYVRYHEHLLEEARAGRTTLYALTEQHLPGAENPEQAHLLYEFFREKYEFGRGDGWRHFHFPGLTVSFRDVGAKVNSQVRVEVTGKFAEGLLPYLAAWAPQGELPLFLGIPTSIGESELIREHGFVLSADNPGVSTREEDGFVLTYRPDQGLVQAAATLKLKSLTKVELDAALDRLDGYRRELA